MVWWLFTLALLAAYIANFTALLSSGSEQLPIQTFEDLVKQRNLEFGTLEGSSTFYYFKVQRNLLVPTHRGCRTAELGLSHSSGLITPTAPSSLLSPSVFLEYFK